MRTNLYIVTLVDENCGEVQGAFHEEGDLLHWWHCNDAMFSVGYFEPILSAFAIDVTDASDDEELVERLRKAATQ